MHEQVQFRAIISQLQRCFGGAGEWYAVWRSLRDGTEDIAMLGVSGFRGLEERWLNDSPRRVLARLLTPTGQYLSLRRLQVFLQRLCNIHLSSRS